MTRIVIAGVPRAGKTTRALMDSEILAIAVGVCGVRHTDDLIASGADWSEISEIVASRWFPLPGPWIIEGVAAVRALRKWLRANATGAPCDRVVWLGSPRVALTPGQAALAKGCMTVWREVRPELLARNVHVEEA